MDRIVKSSAAEKLRLFREAAMKLSIPIAMVEKDFWVSWVLWRIFSDKDLQETLLFKGGTSLSKGYDLIERFSEDLDMVLDKSKVLGDEDLFKPSYKKQREFADEISTRTAEYVSTTLKEKIITVLGKNVLVYSDEEYKQSTSGAAGLGRAGMMRVGTPAPKEWDNKNLHIIYPKVADDDYLRSDILLEIGIMSAWTPNEPKEIVPYIAKVFPELKIAPATVPTIKAKRTFWDKATILHREHHRPENTHTPIRYSRHYYDLYQMALSAVKDDALADFELLAEVIERKDKLYHCAWAKYENCLTGALYLLPNDNNQESLARDYKAMQGMIFGDTPEWSEILRVLQELEKEINKKGEKHGNAAI